MRCYGSDHGQGEAHGCGFPRHRRHIGRDLSPLERSGKVSGWVTRRTKMAPRIVVGVFESEGIAEDARQSSQYRGRARRRYGT